MNLDISSRHAYHLFSRLSSTCMGSGVSEHWVFLASGIQLLRNGTLLFLPPEASFTLSTYTPFVHTARGRYLRYFLLIQGR